MEVLFWIGAGFLCGSIPFSIIIGRLVKNVDIREYGDHNPGGTNVIRSAGKGWGALAILLDALKGAIPVGLAWFSAGLSGWEIVLTALAPVAGHAFSPWLGGRGGKAVAVTFGIWTGLTIWIGPTVMGILLLVMYRLFNSSGWAIFLTLLFFGGFVAAYYGPTDPEFIWIWLGNLALIAWKHRAELASRPVLRFTVM